MIYYRTSALSDEKRPAELRSFKSPFPGADLTESIVGDHRVCGITAPFGFEPPVEGWQRISDGWEVVRTAKFDPTALGNADSKWRISVYQVNGIDWFLPKIITAAGVRAFSVVYGGPDFLPQLTDEQKSMMALAAEIETARANNAWPDMPTQAKWTARLLSLTYLMSPATFAAIGVLSEELIRATLLTAVGHGSEF